MFASIGRWQFRVWIAMGITVLVYAVWSGNAASVTGIFFLSFPTFCSGSRYFAKYPWLRQMLWLVMFLLFCVTMADLGLSRSNDPWFSSSLHRSILGLLGLLALFSGWMVRRAADKRETASDLPPSPRFWPS